MSTDDNEFDNLLKRKLYRDLLFRSVIWIGVASATGYLAVFYQGIKPLDYFERVSKTLAPLANTVGTFSLLLCVIAMMLKDLEATLTKPTLVAATRGYLGGVVRRLAGDLSLWTLGALMTLLATFLMALLNVTMASNEYASVGSLGFLLVVITILTAMANVYVRRAGPTPIVGSIRNPILITLVYVAALAILTGSLFYGVA
ncbi:hypothetical protein [Halothiobacillus sp. DCM-1]|uniref:hypothetical protein n=1 Tax=Halothiobacillus sp. DCM-1 TaxID=3112558 RepID=UPI0032482ED1